jgi:hypothetical protein
MSLFQVVNTQHQILLNGYPVEGVAALVSVFIVVPTLFAAFKAMREASRANLLQNLPVLVIEEKGDDIYLVNDGPGHAHSINFDRYWHFSAEPNFNEYGMTVVSFEKINYLKPGKEVKLNLRFKGAPTILSSFMPFYMAGGGGKKLVFSIRFKDLSNTRLISKVSMKDHNLSIHKMTVRYGIRQKILRMSSQLVELSLIPYYLVNVMLRKFEHNNWPKIKIMLTKYFK